MFDTIKIVSLDTIDVSNMTPVYERAKYYGQFDYSRWVFRDENTRYYYKIWNESYVKSNNIIAGLLSGLYDETTVPALKGLIFYNGYCRGYIMDDLGDVANKNDMISDEDYPSNYSFILKKIKSTYYFPYDFCQKHVRRYKGAYSLMDLEGVHHIDEYDFRLKEHNERGIKGKFINNAQFENDILNILKGPLREEDFLDSEMHAGGGGKEIILQNYNLKTVRDVVEFYSCELNGELYNIENTAKTLNPSNWQYFNCMMAEFRHNVGDHHALGWGNMTKEYYESLNPMSDKEIESFLRSTPVPFEVGFIKHGFHRACSMIGRLIKGKPYIPFYMDLKKYGGHTKNPINNINFIRILDNFGIPRSEYSISNSAILSVMGIESRIRKNGDLDIIISSKVRKFLEKTGLKLPDVVHPFGKDSGKFKLFGCKNDDDLVYNYSVNILGFNFTEPRFYFNRMHRVMNSQHRSFEENYRIKELGKLGVENFAKKQLYKKYPFNDIEFNRWGFNLVKDLEIIK